MDLGENMAGTPGRSGNFQAGADNTRPDGVPDIPAGLSAGGRAKWFDLMDQLHLDLLRQSDVHQLKMLAELLALADTYQATVAADPADHKTARLLLQVAQQINRLSASYGLAPTDRQRLRIQHPTDTDDPFDNWLAQATGAPGF